MSAARESLDAGHGDAVRSAAERLAPRLKQLTLLGPGLVAVVMWRLSLRHVNVEDLGDYGLPPALPLTWYLALGLAVLGAVTAIVTTRSSSMLAFAYVVAIAVILYATVPVLSAQPHYAWVYKHIGVVRYLEAHGQVHPNVDIYNRWPGFFALGAMFSRLAGRADPESYAGWAELFFILLDAALVIAAVKAAARDARIAGGAALFFLLTNWVGQTYYSPQALTFALGLALIAVTLRHLSVAGRAYARHLTRMVEWVGRTPQLALQPDFSVRWPRWASVTVILSLDAVIVASHQLTPYVLLVGVGFLMLAGVARPWLVLIAMAVITFTYLAINFHYIQHNYGLFTSLDPFNNVNRVTAYNQTPSRGKSFNTHVELLASAALWLSGLSAAIFLLKRGLLIRALPLLLLALSPFAIAFGQNYGGEASLRIVLFSSPWWAALIAWALLEIRRRRLRWALMATLAMSFAALFVPSFFGQEELNVIPASEVDASGWFYAHGRPGSVLVLSAPGFPLRYGPTYPEFKGPEGDAYPNILSAHIFRGRQLGARDVPNVISIIKQYANYGYIAFSKEQTAYAQVFRLTPPGALANLEAAVARSPDFRLWYHNGQARIYELIGARAGPAPPTARERGEAGRSLRLGLPILAPSLAPGADALFLGSARSRAGTRQRREGRRPLESPRHRHHRHLQHRSRLRATRRAPDAPSHRAPSTAPSGRRP